MNKWINKDLIGPSIIDYGILLIENAIQYKIITNAC